MMRFSLFKLIPAVMLLFGLTLASASTRQFIHNQNAANALSGFVMRDSVTPVRAIQLNKLVQAQPSVNELVKRGRARFNPKTQVNITRYQQYFHGIPIVGATVTVHTKMGQQSKVLGALYQQVSVSPAALAHYQTPAYLATVAQQVLQAARLHSQPQPNPNLRFTHVRSTLVLFPQKNTAGVMKLTPAIKVHYKMSKAHSKKLAKTWTVLVDAAQPANVLRASSSRRSFMDTGPGGNGKTGLYHYGSTNMPALLVTQHNNQCVLDNHTIRVIDMTGQYPSTSGDEPGSDFMPNYVDPFNYLCGADTRDVGGNAKGFDNGAFSPADDAYYFGQLVADMYHDWLGTPTLADQRGNTEKLRFRVHILDPGFDPKQDKNPHYYDNAFWDSATRTMNFGDGDPHQFYPLISPEVVGHEISHGFTEDHSNLDYEVGVSGSLNESYSDIAGIATKAYLLEKYPHLYRAIYHSDTLGWNIGDTISKQPGSEFRVMSQPSRDHNSADCYDSQLATATCKISYAKVIAKAKQYVPGDDVFSRAERISYIDHTASGIFNHFAYWLASQSAWNVRKVFVLFATANADYWQAESTYPEAVTGLLQAADDLSYSDSDKQTIRRAAAAVGIPLTTATGTAVA